MFLFIITIGISYKNKTYNNTGEFQLREKRMNNLIRNRDQK